MNRRLSTRGRSPATFAEDRMRNATSSVGSGRWRMRSPTTGPTSERLSEDTLIAVLANSGRALEVDRAHARADDGLCVEPGSGKPWPYVKSVCSPSPRARTAVGETEIVTARTCLPHSSRRSVAICGRTVGEQSRNRT